MNNYIIKQIHPDEYDFIRKLDRAAFEFNERGSDGDFHEVFADNIRRSPYYIPELDLVAVTDDGFTYLGHAIFSRLPMGDNGEHIIYLNSLAVRHGENDNHAEKSHEYQRKGIGTALVMHGLEIAKTLGYTGCMTCGHPDVYRKKMGFSDYRNFGIVNKYSTDVPDGALHAIELVPGGFEKTNKLFSEDYYDFSINEQGINPEKLKEALNKMFGTKIVRADCQTKQLRGGYVGNVQLVTGTAETTDGEKLPYKIVLKVQKKWERYGDPGSCRREYDLYMSYLNNFFSDSFRWPECYHAEMNRNETETQLWMEYIDGISGRDLTIEMLEYAAEELGRFQGRLYAQNPSVLKNICCFTQIEAVKTYYAASRPKENEEQYRYIRSEDCEIPEHLRQMLIDVYNETEAIYSNINNMPVVLCHRDFWLENIFYSNGKIILIDWDCTGWGYIFEDIVQLATDEVGFKYIDAYYKKFIPAYLKGFSEYADLLRIANIYEYAKKLLVIKFWSAPVHYYMTAKSSDAKKAAIDALQKIYEMGEKIKIN